MLRHDCQDGSDEFDCDFSSVAESREFRCREGRDGGHRVTDCVGSEVEIQAKIREDYSITEKAPTRAYAGVMIITNGWLICRIYAN